MSVFRLIRDEAGRQAVERAAFNHDRLERIKGRLAGLTLERAREIIWEEYLGRPSDYHLMHLVAAYKRANPHIAWEDIFEAFDYRPRTLKSAASSIYDYHRVMRGDQGQRIMLGWPRLDSYLRGIRPGQVCGVMARAGVGKTTFACNVIVNIYQCEDHPPVMFLSLEMPAAEIAARLFVIDRRISPARVEEYFTRSAEAPLVAEWALRYHDLIIIDEGAPTIEGIAKMYDEAVSYLGRHIPLVIIDYLGLVRGRGASSYERTSYVARELKRLAKAKNTAILSLVQTSREGGTGRERIDMRMARDSGQIEEACDFLLGAWRPNLGEEDLDGSGKYWLSVLKNRHGRTGDVEMVLDFSCLRIREECDG